MSLMIKSIGEFCVFVYVFGMLFSFGSNHLTQKSLRLIFVLYVILAVLNTLRYTPFKQYIFSNNIHQYETVTSLDYIIPQAQKEIEKNIKNNLEAKKISYKDVQVHIIEQSDYVKIDEIVFYGVSQDNRGVVEKLYIEEGNIIFGD